MPTSSDPQRAFAPHDHRRCRGEALAAVEAVCAARRLRLTPARTFVLETLLETHKALTAYELLDRLAAAGLGSQPPVVYRALDFLVANGFVHRIERLGAFVACTHGHGPRADGSGEDGHSAGFLVCRACRTVAEAAVPGPAPGLAAEAEAAGFAVERTMVEVEGLCARCRAEGA